jgi:hypothetical protein
MTQMVAYVLFDRKLAGKYEDGYLRGSIPEIERDMSLSSADWMIQLKPTPTSDESPLDRVGPFLIRRAPFSFYNLESITGAYGTEVGDKVSWNWVTDAVEYRFRHVGKIPKTKVKFKYLLSGNPRTLFVDLRTYSGKKLASFKVLMEGGWGEYESPAIESNSEDVVIRISADGFPSRLSAGDPREVKFLIQNLSFGYMPFE